MRRAIILVGRCGLVSSKSNVLVNGERKRILTQTHAKTVAIPIVPTYCRHRQWQRCRRHMALEQASSALVAG